MESDEFETEHVTAFFVDKEVAPVVTEYVALCDRGSWATLGHSDFSGLPKELAHKLDDKTLAMRGLFVLRRVGRIVAGFEYELSTLDNVHGANVRPVFDPGEHPGPLFDVLWESLLPFLRENDRSVVWLFHTDRLHDVKTESELRVLQPATGVGGLRASKLTDWLEARGFRFEQLEVESKLELDNLGDVEQLKADSARYAAGYKLRSWIGPAPEELLDAIATQRRAMSTDVPTGDIQTEEEAWDAERVRATEQRIAKMGRTEFWTVALVATGEHKGEVVAHTIVVHTEGSPVGRQEDTLVRSDHRGHRLGLLVKIANLQQLMAELPDVRRVWTTNAQENIHMLNINRELGFVAGSVSGFWQLKI